MIKLDRKQAIQLVYYLIQRKKSMMNFVEMIEMYSPGYRTALDIYSYIEDYPKEYQDRYNELVIEFEKQVDILCDDILKETYADTKVEGKKEKLK